MFVRHTFALAAIAALAFSHDASAQSRASNPSAREDAAQISAPAPVSAGNETSAAAARTPAQQLQPSASSLFAPATTAENAATRDASVSSDKFMAHRGAGFGTMIAGGALFVAGLLVGGGAGTALAVAGAGIGAYGLYVYFK